jgi:hypothetical protein
VNFMASRYDTAMHRLTIILSDLYLPPEVVPDRTASVEELPAFEWLLGRSDAPAHIADWRGWLVSQAAGDSPSEGVTYVAACSHLEERFLASTWFATPVHLEARLDHVRLTDRGLLRLAPEERAQLCADFARVLGAPYELHDAGERAFYLTGLASAAARTVDPARLLGADVGTALPGSEAGELRRLGAEIEMWLHGSALNAERERAGKPRVSSLWLWRGPATPPRQPAGVAPIEAKYWGGDPLMAGLSVIHSLPELPAPPTYAKLGEHLRHTLRHAVVEFAPFTGAAHETLTALEQNFFAPAKAALLAGQLREIEIVANDRLFRVATSARWRFWRRPVPWLTRLADRASAAQA